MIKNIILDIGGVIFDDSDLNLSKLLNKDIEEIKKITKVVYGGNFEKCLLGQMTVQEHISKLKEKGIEKTKSRMHKIICLNTMEVFNCEREAHEKYKISRSSINRCCNGYLKSAGKINGEKAYWMKYDEYIKLNTLK